MSNITFQIRKDAIEELSTDPVLHGDNIGLALQRIGETSAGILEVEDVSFWQLSRKGETMHCIAAHNNMRGPEKTMMRVSMDEIEEYIQAIHEVLYLDIFDISRETSINRLAHKFLTEDDKVGASLHVPIFINGAVNGVVQFNKVGTTREWSLQDCVLACQITDLATESIRNFALTLNESYTHDMLDLLGNTLDSLLEALSLSDGMIRLDEIPLTRGYKPEVAIGFADLYRSSPIVSDSTLVIRDIDKTKEDTRNLVSILKDEEVRSVIVAPLLINSHRIGCVLVSSPVVMDWKLEEVAMVTRTANHAARFVQDIWAYQDTHTLSGLIQRFQVSSQTLNHMMMFEEGIREIGRSAADVLETGMAFIALRSTDKIITCPWISGLNTRTINQIITIDSESIDTILRNNKLPVLFPDVVKSILPDSLQRYLMEKKVQAARIFPLVYEDQTLGAVFAFYKHARLYSRNERSVLSLFANTATLTLQNAWMYKQIHQGYLNLALDLANTVDARETTDASIRWTLAELAEKTAQTLNIPEQELTALHWAALLHDIGKKDVPGEVLRKSGPLSEDEWKLLHQTPIAAENMLKPIPQLQNVAKVVRKYRERFDGSGYPDHLKGDQIPTSAKVLAVADAYTSMLMDRPFQKPLLPKEALEEIKRNSGTQFDPVVVNAFSQVMAEVR